MKRQAVWAILLLAHVALLAPAPASAAPPQTLHYQGYLTNSSGAPANGATPFTFKLYAAASGGSELWSETHASVNVGQYTSIAIGPDGLPVISYQDGTNLDLKVAKCANALCAPYIRRR